MRPLRERARRERLKTNMKLSAYICWVLLAIILVPTGVARSDTADDIFVKALAGQRLTGDPSQPIAEGHSVCDDVAGSYLAGNAPDWTFPALGPVMADLHLWLFQARFFINAAESAYCPQFHGLERRRVLTAWLTELRAAAAAKALARMEVIPAIWWESCRQVLI